MIVATPLQYHGGLIEIAIAHANNLPKTKIKALNDDTTPKSHEGKNDSDSESETKSSDANVAPVTPITGPLSEAWDAVLRMQSSIRQNICTLEECIIDSDTAVRKLGQGPTMYVLAKKDVPLPHPIIYERGLMQIQYKGCTMGVTPPNKTMRAIRFATRRAFGMSEDARIVFHSPFYLTSRVKSLVAELLTRKPRGSVELSYAAVLQFFESWLGHLETTDYIRQTVRQRVQKSEHRALGIRAMVKCLSAGLCAAEKQYTNAQRSGLLVNSWGLESAQLFSAFASLIRPQVDLGPNMYVFRGKSMRLNRLQKCLDRNLTKVLVYKYPCICRQTKTLDSCIVQCFGPKVQVRMLDSHDAHRFDQREMVQREMVQIVGGGWVLKHQFKDIKDEFGPYSQPLNGRRPILADSFSRRVHYARGVHDEGFSSGNCFGQFVHMLRMAVLALRRANGFAHTRLCGVIKHNVMLAVIQDYNSPEEFDAIVDSGLLTACEPLGPRYKLTKLGRDQLLGELGFLAMLHESLLTFVRRAAAVYRDSTRRNNFHQQIFALAMMLLSRHSATLARNRSAHVTEAGVSNSVQHLSPYIVDGHFPSRASVCPDLAIRSPSFTLGWWLFVERSTENSNVILIGPESWAQNNGVPARRYFDIVLNMNFGSLKIRTDLGVQVETPAGTVPIRQWVHVSAVFKYRPAADLSCVYSAKFRISGKAIPGSKKFKPVRESSIRPNRSSHYVAPLKIFPQRQAVPVLLCSLVVSSSLNAPVSGVPPTVEETVMWWLTSMQTECTTYVVNELALITALARFNPQLCDQVGKLTNILEFLAFEQDKTQEFYWLVNLSALNTLNVVQQHATEQVRLQTTTRTFSTLARVISSIFSRNQQPLEYKFACAVAILLRKALRREQAAKRGNKPVTQVVQANLALAQETVSSFSADRTDEHKCEKMNRLIAVFWVLSDWYDLAPGTPVLLRKQDQGSQHGVVITPSGKVGESVIMSNNEISLVDEKELSADISSAHKPLPLDPVVFKYLVHAVLAILQFTAVHEHGVVASSRRSIVFAELRARALQALTLHVRNGECPTVMLVLAPALVEVMRCERDRKRAVKGFSAFAVGKKLICEPISLACNTLEHMLASARILSKVIHTELPPGDIIPFEVLSHLLPNISLILNIHNGVATMVYDWPFESETKPFLSLPTGNSGATGDGRPEASSSGSPAPKSLGLDDGIVLGLPSMAACVGTFLLDVEILADTPQIQVGWASGSSANTCTFSGMALATLRVGDVVVSEIDISTGKCSVRVRKSGTRDLVMLQRCSIFPPFLRQYGVFPAVKFVCPSSVQFRNVVFTKKQTEVYSPTPPAWSASHGAEDEKKRASTSTVRKPATEDSLFELSILSSDSVKETSKKTAVINALQAHRDRGCAFAWATLSQLACAQAEALMMDLLQGAGKVTTPGHSNDGRVLGVSPADALGLVRLATTDNRVKLISLRSFSTHYIDEAFCRLGTELCLAELLREVVAASQPQREPVSTANSTNIGVDLDVVLDIIKIMSKSSKALSLLTQSQIPDLIYKLLRRKMATKESDNILEVIAFIFVQFKRHIDGLLVIGVREVAASRMWSWLPVAVFVCEEFAKVCDRNPVRLRAGIPEQVQAKLCDCMLAAVEIFGKAITSNAITLDFSGADAFNDKMFRLPGASMLRISFRDSNNVVTDECEITIKICNTVGSFHKSFKINECPGMHGKAPIFVPGDYVMLSYSPPSKLGARLRMDRLQCTISAITGYRRHPDHRGIVLPLDVSQTVTLSAGSIPPPHNSTRLCGKILKGRHRWSVQVSKDVEAPHTSDSATATPDFICGIVSPVHLETTAHVYGIQTGTRLANPDTHSAGLRKTLAYAQRSTVIDFLLDCDPSCPTLSMSVNGSAISKISLPSDSVHAGYVPIIHCRRNGPFTAAFHYGTGGRYLTFMEPHDTPDLTGQMLHVRKLRALQHMSVSEKIVTATKELRRCELLQADVAVAMRAVGAQAMDEQKLFHAAQSDMMNLFWLAMKGETLTHPFVEMKLDSFDPNASVVPQRARHTIHVPGAEALAIPRWKRRSDGFGLPSRFSLELEDGFILDLPLAQFSGPYQLTSYPQVIETGHPYLHDGGLTEFKMPCSFPDAEYILITFDERCSTRVSNRVHIPIFCLRNRQSSRQPPISAAYAYVFLSTLCNPGCGHGEHHRSRG